MNSFKRGMTLLEMVVTLAVVAVALPAIADISLSIFRSIDVSSGSAVSIGAARSAVDAIVRDVRQADYADNGASPIASMGPYSFSFYADANHDHSAEKITYDLTGTLLTKSVVAASGNPPAYTSAASPVGKTDGIANILEGKTLFHYYDASGTEITDASQAASVRSIGITLVAAGTKGGADISIENIAVPRNPILP